MSAPYMPYIMYRPARTEKGLTYKHKCSIFMSVSHKNKNTYNLSTKHNTKSI